MKAKLDTGAFRIHPLAEMWGAPEAEDYEGIVESIREFGLQRPITRMGDYVIDGRVRLSACLATGVEPRFEEVGELEGLALISQICAANTHSRQLGPYARSEVVWRMADWRPSGVTDSAEGAVGLTVNQVMALAGASESTVKKAKRVVREERGIPTPPHGDGGAGRPVTAPSVPDGYAKACAECGELVPAGESHSCGPVTVVKTTARTIGESKLVTREELAERGTPARNTAGSGGGAELGDAELRAMLESSSPAPAESPAELGDGPDWAESLILGDPESAAGYLRALRPYFDGVTALLESADLADGEFDSDALRQLHDEAQTEVDALDVQRGA